MVLEKSREGVNLTKIRLIAGKAPNKKLLKYIKADERKLEIMTILMQLNHFNIFEV